MKYLVLDIETTAIKPNEGNILEVAMVFDDTDHQRPVDELESIHLFIAPKDGVLYNHRWNLDTLRWSIQHGVYQRYLEAYKDFTDRDNISGYEMDKASIVHSRLLNFYKDICRQKAVDKPQIWGKNIAAFDIAWMNDHCMINGILEDGRQVREIGELYFDPKTMDRLPTGRECSEIAKLPAKEMTHNALEDCQHEVELIRYQFNK